MNYKNLLFLLLFSFRLSQRRRGSVKNVLYLCSTEYSEILEGKECRLHRRTPDNEFWVCLSDAWPEEQVTPAIWHELEVHSLSFFVWRRRVAYLSKTINIIFDNHMFTVDCTVICLSSWMCPSCLPYLERSIFSHERGLLYLVQYLKPNQWTLYPKKWTLLSEHWTLCPELWTLYLLTKTLPCTLGTFPWAGIEHFTLNFGTCSHEHKALYPDAEQFTLKSNIFSRPSIEHFTLNICVFRHPWSLHLEHWTLHPALETLSWSLNSFPRRLTLHPGCWWRWVLRCLRMQSLAL